jgi:hypothetical protein
MARRRAMLMPDDASPTDETFNIAASTFQLCANDGYIVGSLIDDGGQVVPIRMRPDVANEMTRNMLKTAQVASAC